MYKVNFLNETENKRIIEQRGKFNVIEYLKNLSDDPSEAMFSFFASQMNVRKRQLAIRLEDDDITVQGGSMEWMAGDLKVTTNIKGGFDLGKKIIGGKLTNEAVIKPRYTGTGMLVLEPTYKHILLEDLADWNGRMIIENGLFLACDGEVNIKTVMRSTLSSMVLGNEGMFNCMLDGEGIVALESMVPREELVMVDLDNDVLRVDGNYAIAWSQSLKFTVEKTTKTLIGSDISGEGLVNVYRGTGRVLLSPVAPGVKKTVYDEKQIRQLEKQREKIRGSREENLPPAEETESEYEED